MLQASLLLAFACFSLVRADCTSQGVNILDGGSYFVNASSTDDFTATSKFDGCQGTAQIILVAPDETSWECTDVDSSVDNVVVTSTCPIAKDEMYSGTWTLIILDNDGDGQSYTGQRTFELTVGTPQTVTYTPTILASVTSTPTSTSLITSTDSELTTLTPVTVTDTAKAAGKKTVTVTPKRVTVWSTTTIERTRVTTSITVKIATKTEAASCTIVPSPPVFDPPCDPFFLAIAQAVLANDTTTATTSSAPAATTTVSPLSATRGRRVKAPRLRLSRRDIDSATVTVTDSNTADFITSTSTITGTATTVTGYTTVEVTSTITPSPVTIWATPTVTTITAATPTRTRTTHIYTTSLKTKIVTTTYTITTTKSTGTTASCYRPSSL